MFAHRQVWFSAGAAGRCVSHAKSGLGSDWRNIIPPAGVSVGGIVQGQCRHDSSVQRTWVKPTADVKAQHLNGCTARHACAQPSMPHCTTITRFVPIDFVECHCMYTGG